MENEALTKLEKTFGKVLKEAQGSFLSLIIYQGKEPAYFICIRCKNKHCYAKINGFLELNSLNCEDAVFNPYGSFVFARDLYELIDKIINKLNG